MLGAAQILGVQLAWLEAVFRSSTHLVVGYCRSSQIIRMRAFGAVFGKVLVMG